MCSSSSKSSLRVEANVMGAASSGVAACACCPGRPGKLARAQAINDAQGDAQLSSTEVVSITDSDSVLTPAPSTLGARLGGTLDPARHASGAGLTSSRVAIVRANRWTKARPVHAPHPP